MTSGRLRSEATPISSALQALSEPIPKFRPTGPEVNLQTLLKVVELILRSHLTLGCYLFWSLHPWPLSGRNLTGV